MKYFFALITVFITIVVTAQTIQNKPKLVVGIVVDQMRNEYLHRYEDKFGEDGFKKMMREKVFH
jgi:hypothetical protein